MTDNAGPHQGVIVSLATSFVSTCEVSLRKGFPKPPVNAEFFEFVIKCLKATSISCSIIPISIRFMSHTSFWLLLAMQ